jgi:hypothetical protein
MRVIFSKENRRTVATDFYFSVPIFLTKTVMGTEYRMENFIVHAREILIHSAI